jgi:hypothetical protein
MIQGIIGLKMILQIIGLPEDHRAEGHREMTGIRAEAVRKQWASRS